MSFFYQSKTWIVLTYWSLKGLIQRFLKLQQGFFLFKSSSELTHRFWKISKCFLFIQIKNWRSIILNHPRKHRVLSQIVEWSTKINYKNYFGYSCHRIYQYNEDYFLFQFGFLQSFQTAWMPIKKETKSSCWITDSFNVYL